MWKWWKKAGTDLGIEGVDLYAGTRHPTATALGGVLTPEQIQDATGHASKAFKRYFQGERERASRATAAIKSLSASNQPLNNIKTEEKSCKILYFKE